MKHKIIIEIDVTCDHKDAREELLRDAVGTIMPMINADRTFTVSLITVERHVWDEKVPPNSGG